MLRVVADNDAPGTGGEQVFADEPAVVSQPTLPGDISVDANSVVANSVVEIAGTDEPPLPGEETDE
jgi:hypothetical protein